MNQDNADLLNEIQQFQQANPEIEFVDLICLDIPGHFYGKRYPMDMLVKIAKGSVLKLPKNCTLLGVQGGVYPIGDYSLNDGDPDAPRRLIPGTLKPVTWENKPLAQMLITSDNTDAPIEFEPRQVLSEVTQRLTHKGLHPVVAFELEFYLFDKQLNQGKPQFPRDPLSDDADDQANMHIERLSRFSNVLDDIAATAKLQGIDATIITAELGPGQFEINFNHHNDPHVAADWAAMFIRLTRGVALKHGYRASFMAKPYLEHPGNGMHTHISVYDDYGNNVLLNNNQQALRHAVNGCLTLLPSLMPIFAPNLNSYRRFNGVVNTAQLASWGFEDRDASVRIPESNDKNLRLEIRLPGADANPYLTLAALLSSIEYGLENPQEPIAPLNDNRDSGIEFAKDVLQAVQHMASHEVIQCALGKEFVFVYCENKRLDYLQFMQDISEREYRWYL
ncbi:MAG: glutamine synthetase [Gammaproteobacteria bacterium]|nr:glutamine synthetase [Gammaproteobacteria bacterium]